MKYLLAVNRDGTAAPLDFPHHICLITVPYSYHRRLYLTRLPINLEGWFEKNFSTYPLLWLKKNRKKTCVTRGNIYLIGTFFFFFLKKHEFLPPRWNLTLRGRKGRVMYYNHASPNKTVTYSTLFLYILHYLHGNWFSCGEFDLCALADSFTMTSHLQSSLKGEKVNVNRKVSWYLLHFEWDDRHVQLYK